MFWRKRKPHEMKSSPSLIQIAAKLGIERRANVRVKYPETQLSKLPEVYYSDYHFRVNDISVGGCCLLDPEEVLGPQVGHDVELTVHWPTGIEQVKARIVSRVDARRHIQFMNLSKSRQNFLMKSMTSGIRGQGLNNHGFSNRSNVSVEAVELWSSHFGDSVVIENGVHRLAQIELQSEQYHIFRDAWPQKNPGGKCSKNEFEQLILFLSNAPLPTPPLKDLIAKLVAVWSLG